MCSQRSDGRYWNRSLSFKSQISYKFKMSQRQVKDRLYHTKVNDENMLDEFQTELAKHRANTQKDNKKLSVKENFPKLIGYVLKHSSDCFGIDHSYQNSTKEWLTSKIKDIVDKKVKACKQWQLHRSTCEKNKDINHYPTLLKLVKNKAEARQRVGMHQIRFFFESIPILESESRDSINRKLNRNSFGIVDLKWKNTRNGIAFPVVIFHLSSILFSIFTIKKFSADSISINHLFIDTDFV